MAEKSRDEYTSERSITELPLSSVATNQFRIHLNGIASLSHLELEAIQQGSISTCHFNPPLASFYKLC